VIMCKDHDKWVPVTMVQRVLRLQMEERPPIRGAAMNILNKQLQITGIVMKHKHGPQNWTDNLL